jgi:MFS family permease
MSELSKISLVVALGAIMTVIDSTIVNVAVHVLGADLGASLGTIQWVLTGYLLALATTIPISGWVIERFGARAVWLTALSLFIAGSVLCGLAWSAASLVTFRLVQGVGGGLIMPVAQTMLAQAAGPARMARAMAVVSIPGMLAPALGPVLGGVLLDHLSWRWMFLINAPVCAAALILAIRVLPRGEKSGASSATGRVTSVVGRAASPERGAAGQAGSAAGQASSAAGPVGGAAGPAGGAAGQAGGAAGQAVSAAGQAGGVQGKRLDLVGLFLLSPGLAALIYGLAQGGKSRFALAVGAVLLGAFVGHALRRGERALIDLRLFRRRSFAAAVGTIFGYSAAMSGALLLIPLYAQVVRGGSVLDAGLAVAPLGAGAIVTMSLAGRINARLSPRWAGAAGIVLVLAGLTTYGKGGAFVMGLGHGVVTPCVMAGAYRDLRKEEIPGATTASTIMVRLGSALGAAVFAVLLEALSRHVGPAAAFAGGREVAFAIVALCLIPAMLL